MTFSRGLRALLRRDGVALVQFPDPDAIPRFTDRLALTLSPGGVSVLLDEAKIPSALPEGARIVGRLSLVTALGVGLGGGENLARRMLIDLGRAKIAVRAVSLCDLAVAVALDTADAEAAMDVITASVPLTR